MEFFVGITMLVVGVGAMMLLGLPNLYMESEGFAWIPLLVIVAGGILGFGGASFAAGSEVVRKISESALRRS